MEIFKFPKVCFADITPPQVFIQDNTTNKACEIHTIPTAIMFVLLETKGLRDSVELDEATWLPIG